MGKISLVGIGAGDINNVDFMHRYACIEHETPIISINVVIQKISTPTVSTERIYKINDEDHKNLFMSNIYNNKVLKINILLLPFAKRFILVNLNKNPVVYK